MGAWGTRVYENDSALDLTNDLSASISKDIKREISAWCIRTKDGERIDRDIFTIPALGQFVLDLRKAMPSSYLVELIEIILPLLEDTMEYEINREPRWENKGEDVDRVSVLKSLRMRLKEFVARFEVENMSTQLRIDRALRHGDQVTGKELEETIERLRKIDKES